MKALIDGDILVYRVGFASEHTDEWIAIARLDKMIVTILQELETDEYTIYLTSQDKSNFRFEMYPSYKANRVQPKPIHYLLLRNTLCQEYDAQVIEGQEADDALAQAQTEETIICTIDKDLDQVPGWHYNFVQRRKYNITKLEAVRQHYWQMLVGDTSDNVEGCPGIGRKKATRILEGCQDETEMLSAVITNFQSAFGIEWLEKLWLAGSVLWIRKKLNQGWIINGEVVSKEMLENFSKRLESDLNTSPNDMSILFQNLIDT